MAEYFLIEKRQDIITLTLNRPELFNAINEKILLSFRDFLQKFHKEPSSRVVILQGKGKAFSAGADLAWMEKTKDYTFEENLADARVLAEVIDLLFHLPCPTIAKVQGHAFGGGVGFMAACDFVIAYEKAEFGFTEARLGLAPACISGPVIFRLGPLKAKQLFLTGRRFSAKHGFEIGLVDQLASSLEDLDYLVENLVKELFQCSPNAQRACKELAHTMGNLSREDKKEFGAKVISKLRVSEDGKEGIRAFFEKRKPKWVSPQ